MRALLDELDGMAPEREPEGHFDVRLIEELVRLGWAVIDVAAHIAENQSTFARGEFKPAHRITVRRHEANATGSTHDFVVEADDLGQLEQQLAGVLKAAQAERGRGAWSGRDPEIWDGGIFVTRLEPDADVAQVVRRAVDALTGGVGQRGSGVVKASAPSGFASRHFVNRKREAGG